MLLLTIIVNIITGHSHFDILVHSMLRDRFFSEYFFYRVKGSIKSVRIYS